MWRKMEPPLSRARSAQAATRKAAARLKGKEAKRP